MPISIACAAALLLTSAMAYSLRAEPAAITAIDCATATDTAHKALADAGRAAIEQTWLKSASGWLTSYEIAGEGKNPLLPNAPVESPSAAIRGFVFSSGWTCAILPSQDPSHALLKISAATYRFHENGAGWTNASPNGVVLALLGKRTNDVWSTAPVAADEIIFPQGTSLKRPYTAQLPPHDKWPERGCRPPKLWTGERCAHPPRQPVAR